MLDITFYTKEGKSKSIDLSSDTYEFLAKAGFGKISKTVPTKLTIDDEDTTLDLVVFDDKVDLPIFIDEEVLEISSIDLYTKREQYSYCIREAFVNLCYSIKNMDLKDEGLENVFKHGKALKEILLQIENENNKFMEF